MSRSSYGREAIQKVPDGLGMIRRLMQSTNTKVRLSGIVICCELGQSTQEWDVTFVTTMLKSDDASEQIRVCSALPSLVKDSQIRAKLLNEETMKILTKLCRTKDNDHLKRQCAQCLALLVVYDGVPALIVEIEAVNDIRDLLDDTHSPVAVSALELLTSLAADGEHRAMIVTILRRRLTVAPQR
ncbi:ARM repeat-containing protein [Paxillus ammoniavirescens]|nr:ARM repeat-containing protein [Paxillus ammoniavirescens]